MADEVATPDTGAEPAETNEAPLEGTTPEEVASVLKNSGINLPAEPKAAAADEEEGEDPDKPVAEDAAGEGKPDEEVANEEPVEPEEPAKEEPAKPETKAGEPAADDTASDKYSFTVEDADGVTWKISAGDSLEKVLDGFQPNSYGQSLDIIMKLNDLNAEKAIDDHNTQEAETARQQEERVSKIQEGWKAEIQDLTANKRIPEGEEGESRIAEVYQFMHDENGKRIEAGRPTIGSFEDAFDKLEAKEAREAKDTASKEAKNKARENGSKVGGSSAPATSSSPAYKPGTARNSQEAIRALGLL